MTELIKSLRLRASQRIWERLAARDALWAVLSDPNKSGGRWDPGEFFASGEVDVADALATLHALHLGVGTTAALDFGCGAGRLTRALASRFDHVVGVDLSAAMIETARRLNADRPNVTFQTIANGRLSAIGSGSFDFVYSRLVLQHVQPTIALDYVRGFLRVLRPGGVAMFSAPTRDPRSMAGVRPILRAARELVPVGARMSVFAIPRARVEQAITSASGRVVAALDDEAPKGWPGYLYVAEKLA